MCQRLCERRGGRRLASREGVGDISLRGRAHPRRIEERPLGFGADTMDDAGPYPPMVFLIVIDEDRKLFTVAGPLANDQPWNSAVAAAQQDGRLVGAGRIVSPVQA